MHFRESSAERKLKAGGIHLHDSNKDKAALQNTSNNYVDHSLHYSDIGNAIMMNLKHV